MTTYFTYLRTPRGEPTHLPLGAREALEGTVGCVTAVADGEGLLGYSFATEESPLGASALLRWALEGSGLTWWQPVELEREQAWASGEQAALLERARAALASRG